MGGPELACTPFLMLKVLFLFVLQHAETDGVSDPRDICPVGKIHRLKRFENHMLRETWGCTKVHFLPLTAYGMDGSSSMKHKAPKYEQKRNNSYESKRLSS